jgi:hypothetical protein
MNGDSPNSSHTKPFSVGDSARILTIPRWLTHDLPEEEVQRLLQCEGTVMRVLEIDSYGYLWFGARDEGRWFCLTHNEIERVESPSS